MRLQYRIVAGLCWAAAVASLSIDLGTADSFAVLGAQSVTNTGPSLLTGDLGISPGTSITGFPPGDVTGSTHDNDAVAEQAQADARTAYSQCAAVAPTDDLTGKNLGGLTLQAGVYKFTSSASLTGELTLDAQGDPDSVWVFQITSTLITGSNSVVALINSAQVCNIYWQVGSSATLGTSTDFAGNVLAQTSITSTTGASSNGGLYALTGSVSLDDNRINAAGPCSPASVPDASGSSTGSSTGSSSGATATASTSASAPDDIASTTEPSVSSASTESVTEGPSRGITDSPSPASTTTRAGNFSSNAIPTSTFSITTDTATAGTPVGGGNDETASTSATGGGTRHSPSPGNGRSGNDEESGSSGLTGSRTTLDSNSHSTSSDWAAGTSTTPNHVDTGSSHRGIQSAKTLIKTTYDTRTFTATCTTAPTTITSYEQTFVVQTPCTTVLTCTPTPTVESYVVFTSSCDRVPTEIATAGETFTITTTGYCTLTCMACASATPLYVPKTVLGQDSGTCSCAPNTVYSTIVRFVTLDVQGIPVKTSTLTADTTKQSGISSTFTTYCSSAPTVITTGSEVFTVSTTGPCTLTCKSCASLSTSYPSTTPERSSYTTMTASSNGTMPVTQGRGIRGRRVQPE
ncbi:MAG: hypothetical protein M1825_005728 [Sarcosagium campestre]|nr:MAG: hypothetical protein M1825_005728 [Sarcosagium campestre]